MLHFWWLGITFLFFQSTPQSCPRHSGLTSLQSFPLFNLLKNQTVLLCWEGGPPQWCTNTYHAIHVMVTQLKKCLVWCKSQRSHIFSIIHDIFKLLNKILSFSLSHCSLFFFTSPNIWEVNINVAHMTLTENIKAKEDIEPPHGDKACKTKLNGKKTQRLLIADHSLYLIFMQLLP